MVLRAGLLASGALRSVTYDRPGASHPEELVARAAQLGYTAIALTDECSMAGVVRAHTAALEHDIKLLIGTQLRCDDGLHVVLLATDRASYGNLSAVISAARRDAPKGRYRLTRGMLAQASGCLALWLPGASPEVADAHWLASCFPDSLWVAVALLRCADDALRLSQARALARDLGTGVVGVGDVCMHIPSRRAVHDVLTAVDHGTTVAELGFQRLPNAERHLRSRDSLAALYPEELLRNALAVARRCSFSLHELRYEYPREVAPSGMTPAAWLRQLTIKGMGERWPDGAPRAVRQQVEHELALITELRYEPFFLTVHDVVRFARRRGILCQGRGSAANSAVCFCLGITQVDPARMSMLFERFISRERNEPPDIDVDFEHDRREEVIQYIYQRYGRQRAALAATVVCYRPRSAVRDVGKALGLGLDQVDRLARSLAWWDGHRALAERMDEAGVDPDSLAIRQLVAILDVVIGFPRHLSQHVGGFVIARDQLCELVPIENAAMPARTVIQWDKDDLEALGLLKVDVLALGMLSAIRRSFDLIRSFYGRHLDMASVPPEDPVVYDMICAADTVGVFQIESRAQMAMLPRLKPRHFYDLVIEVAIVRPGPIQGGMVHPYLRRRQGTEPVTYPSEAVRSVLERTLGIPIFQEQVMQLAVVAAGFTPGEADQLRRAMAAWRRRGGLGPFEQRLVEGMRERGYEEGFARQVFNQIKGFGEYGFPESHSASFALLVYVSCWLKCHEPAVFTCALLNSQPMGFYAPSQLVQDLRRHQVCVEPVDVFVSEWDSTLEPDAHGKPALRLGMRLVKGLREDHVREFVGRRIACVPMDDALRVFSRKELKALAGAGALAHWAGHRRLAAWQILGMERLPGLLEEASFSEHQPDLQAPAEAEDLVADYAHVGLTLGRHPMALLRPRFASLRTRRAVELDRLPHGRFVRAAGLVVNRQRPATASGVIFMTLEDESGFVNVVVWPWVVERQRRLVVASRLLLVQGTIERDEKVVHLVAGRLEDYSPWLGRLASRSRDFH
ncbi:MAG: error-prone DNA polymerase [Pseudomonadota bacterium]